MVLALNSLRYEPPSDVLLLVDATPNSVDQAGARSLAIASYRRTMPELERLRLSSKRSEASALLAITSATVLDTLDADAAWWMCHDEGDLDAMVSIATEHNNKWAVRTVPLQASGGRRTDAEALARIDDTIFVFGSNFIDKSGRPDSRRAFIGRFSEREAIGGTVDVDVLDVGGTLSDLVASALGPVALLEADEPEDLVNLEGAGFVDDDLMIGLRWPVTASGQPILVRIFGAAPMLLSSDWSSADLAALNNQAIAIDVEATPKRPAGVRGLTITRGAIHLVVGQTERDLTAKKVKAATARHVRLALPVEGANALGHEVERFEGFRKVEGVAPTPAGGWVYALDDEDAVVLLERSPTG